MDITIGELLDYIKGLGIAAGPTFAFFWWRADMERRKLQTELSVRAEKYINSVNSQNNAMLEVTRSVAGAQQTLKDMSGVMSELASIANAARTGVRKRSQ